MSKFISQSSKRELLKKANVVGEGYGIMVKDGKEIGKGIVVTVERKLPRSEVSEKDMIPKTIDGLTTDVIEVGHLRALSVNRRDNSRPFPMGVSIGHYKITAGTAGCVVEKNNEKYILTNNHVAANCNLANIGDPVFKAGPIDGGKERFGVLSEYIPLVFTVGGAGCAISNIIVDILNIFSKYVNSSVSFRYDIDPTTKKNKIDAALVKPDNYSLDIINEMADLGKVYGIKKAFIGDKLCKSGRTTSVTGDGLVRLIDYDTIVNYGSDGDCYFEDQILVEKNLFSQGGDSGSAVLIRDTDGRLHVVGLLFAGSDTHTVVSHIDDVISLLGITVYTGD